MQNIIKRLNDQFSITFNPNPDYIPQTALASAQGTFSVEVFYQDILWDVLNIFLTIEEVFFAINTLSILDADLKSINGFFSVLSQKNKN